VKLKVIVLPPGSKTIVVVDEETNELLLLATTRSNAIQPGEYTEPEDIVDIFKYLATRGRLPKNMSYNPRVVYDIITKILATDLPLRDKLEEVKKYVRVAIRA